MYKINEVASCEAFHGTLNIDKSVAYTDIALLEHSHSCIVIAATSFLLLQPASPHQVYTLIYQAYIILADMARLSVGFIP